MSLEINITFARVLKKTKPVELTTGFEETKNSCQNSLLITYKCPQCSSSGIFGATTKTIGELFHGYSQPHS